MPGEGGFCGRYPYLHLARADAPEGRFFRMNSFANYGARDVPLRQYMELAGLFLASIVGLFTVMRARGHSLPKFRARDIVLFGIATHKLSRLIAKDRVTSPFRAPFARFKKEARGGELEEESRGSGLQRAIGDLVTCPFCMSPWIATGLTFGFILNPRFTRLAAGLFTSIAMSHYLHWIYAILEKKESHE